MLLTVSAIINYEIEARDGQSGTLNDILCENGKWRPRWLVIDSGTILPQKLTVLPFNLLKSIDREFGKAYVEATSEAIKNAPLYFSKDTAARPNKSGKEVGVDDETGADTGSLLSLNTMIGFTIETNDGAIGTIFDFLLNDSDWNIRYIIVDTGTWLPGQKVLIAPNFVSLISNDKKLMQLTISREKVKHAPAYNPSITLDGNYDEKFLTYYGIRWLEG